MGTLRRGSRETFPLRTMGRAPCCDKARVKRGIWSSEEDAILKSYIERHGTGGNWIALPKKAGLNRCGKSCRLRWLNYLRPDIKRGGFTAEEESVIFNLYNRIGRRWSLIAAQLPGRTDNEIKNYWNANLKKKRLVANTDFISPTIAPSPQTPSVVIKAEPSSSTCLSPSLQDVSASSSSPSFDDGGGSDIFRVLDLGVSSDQFLSWANLGEGSAASGTNYGSASGLDPWDDVGIYERKLQLERDLGCGDDHSL